MFCGYGEPTCQLDILLRAAEYAKKEKGLKTSLNAPSKEKYEDVTKPVVANAFENMIDFTKRCRQEIGDVKWTIVDVLPEEEKDRCIALSKENDIPLRIRKFSKNNP